MHLSCRIRNPTSSFTTDVHLDRRTHFTTKKPSSLISLESPRLFWLLNCGHSEIVQQGVVVRKHLASHASAGSRENRGRSSLPLERLGGYKDPLACATNSLHNAQNRAHLDEFSIHATLVMPVLGDVNLFSNSFLPRPEQCCRFRPQSVIPSIPSRTQRNWGAKTLHLLPSNLLLGVHHPLDLRQSFDYTSNGATGFPISS